MNQQQEAQQQSSSLILEQIGALLNSRKFRELREVLTSAPLADVAEVLSQFAPEQQAAMFRILPKDIAADIFEYLDLEHQTALLNALGDSRVAVILDSMDPDDRTALLEEIPAAAAQQLLKLLSAPERQVALSLLGFPEHSVGRLMNPHYLAVRENLTVQQVLDHIRQHGKETDLINVIFVLDERGKLLSDLRIRDILLAPADRPVGELIKRRAISLLATEDQEQAVEVFKKYDRNALPVVSSNQVMMGVVTVDDVLDVAEEEATEDIQKLGGVEALEEAYITTPFGRLVHKRAKWLVILFIGELLTASAMAFYEDKIRQAVILALFIPLIISSGGNSGSQAATLIIRALSVGEIQLRDWWRVLRREAGAGLVLGILLGLFGFARVAVWSKVTQVYGPDWILVAITVSLALLLIVMWGIIAGAMLPFVLKRLGADPATSSTPFVATLVDVTGLVIYFSVATWVLRGVIL
ncbi:MAG: magnesium transporter [Proteobacteria bacterium]|nr:MAG: magnesium transporter [Pseudomonadota bacterium]